MKKGRFEEHEKQIDQLADQTNKQEKITIRLKLFFI